MNVKEFKQQIDRELIDEVPKDGAYFAFAKDGKELSVSFEGNRVMLANCFLSLMKTYTDVADVLMTAVEAYEIEKEEEL